MIDLNRLRVSLTKHGAHKLSVLLEKYKTTDVLDKLWRVEPGIAIELAQAKKNLSVGKDNKVPQVWNRAKAAGSESIRALVLIGILFSHHELIEALRQARTGPFKGTIHRDSVLTGKAFTNTANNIEELGYSVSHTDQQVSYNFARLVEIPGLHELVLELLTLKFREAGWSGETNLVDEFVNHGLNEAFAITEDQFRNWLATGNIDALGDTLEDEDYFLDSINDQGRTAAPFEFSPGHTPRKTGEITVSAPTTGTMAKLLHNELQSKLYKELVKVHGERCVRTELPTGHGTSIDVVVKTDKHCWFYEIKVAKTLKACIRQAIPQLLEYAYWRKETHVADRLYIASRFEMTQDAAEFLELLRSRFNIPLHYEKIM